MLLETKLDFSWPQRGQMLIVHVQLDPSSSEGAQYAQIKNIALLRSFDNVSDIGSRNIWSLRDPANRLPPTTHNYPTTCAVLALTVFLQLVNWAFNSWTPNRARD